MTRKLWLGFMGWMVLSLCVYYAGKSYSKYKYRNQTTKTLVK
jgi:hypothetical protein